MTLAFGAINIEKMHLTVELDSGYELRLARGRSLIRLSVIFGNREIKHRRTSEQDLRSLCSATRPSLFQGSLHLRRRRNTIWIYVHGQAVASLSAQLLEVALDVVAGE